MSNAREGEYVAACPLIYVLASALFAAFAMTFKTFFDMLHFSLLTFSLAVLKGGSVAQHRFAVVKHRGQLQINVGSIKQLSKRPELYGLVQGLEIINLNFDKYQMLRNQTYDSPNLAPACETLCMTAPNITSNKSKREGAPATFFA